ncbi:hypothetical protein ALI22I_42550 [Saccharothrix sp. ALI-22-I]|uniref:DUF6292 family protein n=1 Tax=Saccharothrix sp. ALI-22-I TaxID=1933778 RepID=UPI00097BC684|nr:DUF6292 family protein [Saccharothrix sp. ALI-22-I]ONI80107.1 hypothetical protein ALI22I_42550 [Saccharothrix sp. ALI-22-I]
MELEFDDAMTWGLRGYVRLVAEALDLTGDCWYVSSERPATTYLAVEGALPGFPDRDVALLWDEESGWSAAVETHSGEDLIVQARFGAQILPSPRAVARWVRGLYRGERRAKSRYGVPERQGKDLDRRLESYAAAALVSTQPSR